MIFLGGKLNLVDPRAQATAKDCILTEVKHLNEWTHILYFPNLQFVWKTTSFWWRFPSKTAFLEGNPCRRQEKNVESIFFFIKLLQHLRSWNSWGSKRPKTNQHITISEEKTSSLLSGRVIIRVFKIFWESFATKARTIHVWYIYLQLL